MKRLYFDCFSELCGEIVIGALIDLGISYDSFLKDLDKLGVDGYNLEISKKVTEVSSGTSFKITQISSDTQSKSCDELIQIIEASKLHVLTKGLSIKLIHELARKTSNALENWRTALISMTSAAICVNLLNVEEIAVSSDFAFGRVKFSDDIGCSIIKVLAKKYGAGDENNIIKVGYGISEDGKGFVNALRVTLSSEKDRQNKVISEMYPELPNEQQSSHNSGYTMEKKQSEQIL